MTRPRLAACALATVLAIVLVGCATSLQSPRPSATGSASSAPSTAPSTAPLEAQPPVWPSVAGVDLPPGTYFGSPPFELSFTLVIGETGWRSGHVHAEFLSLIRSDGLPETDLPAVLFGFATPTMIRGAGGNVPVAGLTPDAAIDALAARVDIASSKRAAAELFGRAGARVDLRAQVANTVLFGGLNGNFGLGPERDVRIVAVAQGNGLLLVLVMAPPGEVEEAWIRVQPIIASIDLAGA